MWERLLVISDGLFEEAFGWLCGLGTAYIVYLLNKRFEIFKSNINRKSEIDVHKNKEMFSKRIEVLGVLIPMLESKSDQFYILGGCCLCFKPETFEKHIELLQSLTVTRSDLSDCHDEVKQAHEEITEYLNINRRDLGKDQIEYTKLALDAVGSLVNQARKIYLVTENPENPDLEEVIEDTFEVFTSFSKKFLTNKIELENSYRATFGELTT